MTKSLPKTGRNRMKALLIVSVLILAGCAGAPPRDNGADGEIRAAQPGVVDHNVIPKRSSRLR